jgi:release factor glutamine methyltransferase
LLLEKHVPPPPSSVLDLGTGTGAIALALAQGLPKAAVTAVDRSTEALELARHNARTNGLEKRVAFVQSDWFAGLPETARFHWIVSNPPYLSEGEYAQLAPEIRAHEPRAALVAEDAGAADLVTILREARTRLEPGGLVALETGLEHHPRLLDLARDLGYASAEGVADLTGRPRFVLARVA